MIPQAIAHGASMISQRHSYLKRIARDFHRLDRIIIVPVFQQKHTQKKKQGLQFTVPCIYIYILIFISTYVYLHMYIYIIYTYVDISTYV